MNRLGFKSMVFHGDFCLGEVEIFSTGKDQNFRFPNNEIRINYISPPGERCHPLSILQTISPFTVRCKLKSVSTVEKCHLGTLYISCLQEQKTAIVLLGGEELHLVAMPSKQEKLLPCFWCCSVPIGRYGSCLAMLNLRCLAIVFDLDETLIVANTMKSFEDKIDSLQKRLECEDDPLRVQGMSAEMRRYVEDRSLLKQYTESDNVMDNGKLFTVQFEGVQSLLNNQEKVIRPVIRLKERNIVLTRINPEIRDTSVLVRLRPAWEELRSYLTAKGRKRFEVYVCTMAERDYALEMWRLLDPEAHLISSNQLLNRVVCVKSGSRKSLSSVFQDGMCHPKMAMVIDDRLKVWEDNDQPRVHVVPAFTPYYAPQAETASAVPVLFVARNVACNVRTGFFKEFDENILRRIFDLCYEDEVANIPCSPDVSDFLMSEDETHTGDLAPPFITKIPDLRSEASQQPVPMSPNVTSSEILRTNLPLHQSGLREAPFNLEVNPSELDPFRKKKPTLQHGQNSSDPSLLSKLPTNTSLPPIQSCGGWLVEEDLNMDHTNKRAAGSAQAHQNLPSSKLESIRTGTSSSVSEVKNEEAYSRQEEKKQNHSQSNHSLLSEGEISISQANKEPGTEAGKAPPPYIEVLLEIGQRCGSKIEFRSVVSTSKELHFSVEVLFTGDKIGAGMGKTKRDAQYQAAEDALRTLAAEYREYVGLNSGSVDGDSEMPFPRNENGFLWDDPEPDELPLKQALPDVHTSEAGGGATLGLKSFGTQDARKRGNSPRQDETVQNKRLKGEFAPRSQITSSQQHKNGSTVS